MQRSHRPLAGFKRAALRQERNGGEGRNRGKDGMGKGGERGKLGWRGIVRWLLGGIDPACIRVYLSVLCMEFGRRQAPEIPLLD